jgi:hypothetical protein
MKINKYHESFQDPTKVRDVEVMPHGGDMYDAPKAAKRMAQICATSQEVELYRYSPNAARGNSHPGMPLDEDMQGEVKVEGYYKGD